MDLLFLYECAGKESYVRELDAAALFQIEVPVAVTPLILQPQSKCQVTEKET
jgi:hypothetical protein